MTQTTLLLLLGAVGLVAVLLMVAIVGWFLLRRRGATDEPEEDEPIAVADSRPQKPTRKLNRPDTSENGTTEAAQSVPVPAVSPPAASLSGAATLPIADMEHPVEMGDKIRILVVDDNPGTRDNVSRLLYFEKDMEVIGQAINGRQGIEMAVELRPHIVLMDINMPDVDGITATGEMSLRVPYCQVIIMSVQAEQHYMKQAMSAGARDFQPKPFTADELISCIRRVYQIGVPMYRQIEASQQAGATRATKTSQAPESGEGGTDGAVIAVYSAKGGIGTSTLAVNVAAALQQMHGEVALIDADLQFGDIFVHLNIQPSRTMSDSIHNNQFDAELLPELMLAHNSGLKVLLAPPQPELADAITPEMLVAMIKTLRKHFKAVVIDVSRQLTDKSLTILDNADRVLMVTAPELTAIKNAKLFLELAPQLEFPPEKIDVIMNYAKLPGGVSVEKIEKALQLSQSFSVPYDPRLRTATNKGVTVVQQDSGAPAAKAIMALAKAVWQKAGAPDGKERVPEAV